MRGDRDDRRKFPALDKSVPPKSGGKSDAEIPTSIGSKSHSRAPAFLAKNAQRRHPKPRPLLAQTPKARAKFLPEQGNPEFSRAHPAKSRRPRASTSEPFRPTFPRQQTAIQSQKASVGASHIPRRHQQANRYASCRPPKS